MIGIAAMKGEQFLYRGDAHWLAMRDAVIADLLALPGVQVGAAVDDAAPALPTLPTGAVPLRALPGEALLDCIIRTADGQHTAAEILGHREYSLTRLYESA